MFGVFLCIFFSWLFFCCCCFGVVFFGCFFFSAVNPTGLLRDLILPPAQRQTEPAVSEQVHNPPLRTPRAACLFESALPTLLLSGLLIFALPQRPNRCSYFFQAFYNLHIFTYQVVSSHLQSQPVPVAVILLLPFTSDALIICLSSFCLLTPFL